MKTYRETYIRRAEISQLILLHQIYRQTGSQDLIFKGGTAIRWCYGGSRFSEDLDFVTPLAPEDIRARLKKALTGAEQTMIPHFGIGSLTMSEKSARTEALKFFADFRPESSREKISVKLEFEGITGTPKPESANRVLSALPYVAYLTTSGEFRVPQANAVLVVETPAEILSDKVRSLLERRYLKGRDLFDVWHLRTNLKAAVEKETVERKFRMYRTPFVARRDMDYYAVLPADHKKELREAMDRDLARFLPPEVLTVHRKEGYAAFLESVRSLFTELKKMGVRLP